MKGAPLAWALGLPAAALAVLFAAWLQLRSVAEAPALADDEGVAAAEASIAPARSPRFRPSRPEPRRPPEPGFGLEARSDPAPEPAVDALLGALDPIAELEIEAPRDPRPLARTAP